MSTLHDVITQATSLGTKDKTSLLMEYKEFTYVECLLYYMLNASIVYNITKVPTLYRDETPSITTDKDLTECIRMLLLKDLRGAALKSEVANIYGKCTPELREVFKWVLARKNPAKIGTSIVNKVWPNLLYKQMYMGAVPGSQEALERLDWSRGIAVQDKIDGMTILVNYVSGIPISLHTRNGQNITRYFPIFLSRCNHMEPDFNTKVHHECLIQDPNTLEFYDRATGNGLVNKQIKNGVVGGNVDNCMHSVLLDMYTPDMQIVRYQRLEELENQFMTVVPQQIMYSLEAARKYAQGLILLGKEGVVCKDQFQPFKQGKPWFCVKIKHEFDVELLCVGATPHSKHPELIGALTMVSHDRELEVNVGSGLTDELRNRGLDFYTDMVITVTANEITTSKTKKTHSLGLPRFEREGDELRVRHSKDRADTLSEIFNQYKMSKGI